MTEQVQPTVPPPPSIEATIREWGRVWGFRGSPREQEQLEDLVRQLTDREEMLADYLRLAGIQFGVFPQIMAKVFMDAGLGRSIPESQQAMVNRQFTELMVEFRRQMGLE